MPTRRQLLLTAATGLAGIGVLPACSRGGEEPEPAEGLRLRVWNEQAAAVYEKALTAFTDTTGISVEVQAMAWESYWTQLPLDAAEGSLPDVFWMNTAHLDQYRDGQHLVEVGTGVGDLAAAWEPVATDLYRREDGLWGVPQLWEQSVLVANRQLVDEVGGDPSALRVDLWAESDPLRDLALALTVDSEGRRAGEEGFDPAARRVTGFSAHPDRTAVLGPFIAGAGGSWQDDEGAFTFASEAGVAAVRYLAGMAAAHLAPPGTETTAQPRLCRDLFTKGQLGLLQTGTYDLRALTEGVGEAFPWSLHPVVAGPEGTRPLVHAIAAVGRVTKSEERTKEIAELLSWLGGVDAQRPLAEARLGIPAHRDLRGAWDQAWGSAGVDTTAIAGAPQNPALPEHGLRSAEGTAAALPIIGEVFRGEADVNEAMSRAQQAADEARG